MLEIALYASLAFGYSGLAVLCLLKALQHVSGT
jgi:hypothetical protein